MSDILTRKAIICTGVASELLIWRWHSTFEKLVLGYKLSLPNSDLMSLTSQTSSQAYCNNNMVRSGRRLNWFNYMLFDDENLSRPDNCQSRHPGIRQMVYFVRQIHLMVSKVAVRERKECQLIEPAPICWYYPLWWPILPYVNWLHPTWFVYGDLCINNFWELSSNNWKPFFMNGAQQ